MKELLDSFESFMTDIEKRLEKLDILIQEYLIDHVCWRCETLEEYYKMKAQLGNKAKLVIEQIFNGRPFSIFLLSEPLIFKGNKIYCIELPSPGGSEKYKSGRQHIEILTAKSREKLLGKENSYKDCFVERPSHACSSHRDGYIQWDDLISVRTRKISLFISSLYDKDTKLTVNIA